MRSIASVMNQLDLPYISTGHLPTPELCSSWSLRRTRGSIPTPTEQNSQVYPALARVPSELFGICVVGAAARRLRGRRRRSRILDHERVEAVRVRAGLRGDRPGASARRSSASMPPGSRSTRSTAIERSDGGRTNPMVNSGAIATTSLVPGATRGEMAIYSRWPVALRRTYAPAERRSLRFGVRDQFPQPQIARLLQSFGRVYCDPAEATDLYTRQCSLNVSAKDLAVMGATLADGGVNPITKERVVDATVATMPWP